MTAPYYADEQVTLFHGDCREITAWLEADVLVTDPPYGVAFDSGWLARPHKGKAAISRAIAGDAAGLVRDTVRELWGDERPWLMFGTWRTPRPRGTAQVLIWDKTDGVGPGMGDLSTAFGTSHEEIHLGGQWPKKGRPRRGSVLRTSIAMGNPAGLIATSGHPTPKPLGLMEVLVAASTGAVADPFSGSGSTLIAAKTLGRRAIGVEIDERYCEVAAKRLAQDTLFGGVA